MTDTRRTCLYINNSPPPGPKHLAKLGGGSKSLLALLVALPTQGWDAHVVVPGGGQFTDAVADLGITHTRYPFQPMEWRQPLATWRTLRAWQRIMREIRPALIHANSFEMSHSFALAAASLGIPYLTHVRFPVDLAGVRWVLRGLPKPAAFIFNSQSIRDGMWPDIRQFAPKSTPYVVHNAVDLATHAPAAWPEGPLYRIGIVANFAPLKRHEDFLRMAAEMLKTRQDLEFWVVGDDIEGSGRRTLLEQLAAALGVAGHTRFLGHRSDIPDLMRQLHLLIVPSEYESFGRVVIEAMACGRPVVASRTGGIPEIIIEGKTGHLVEVGDWAGFAHAALALLAQRERWETMSHQAIEDVRARFSIAANTAQITAIYDAVMRPHHL